MHSDIPQSDILVLVCNGQNPWMICERRAHNRFCLGQLKRWATTRRHVPQNDAAVVATTHYKLRLVVEVNRDYSFGVPFPLPNICPSVSICGQQKLAYCARCEKNPVARVQATVDYLIDSSLRLAPLI
jgi:hypothetical protein